MLPCSESILKKQNAFKLKFTHFPVIKTTIERITFENWSESSIIFQSFLFANIPGESTPYALTFFVQMKGPALFQGVLITK